MSECPYCLVSCPQLEELCHTAWGFSMRYFTIITASLRDLCTQTFRYQAGTCRAWLWCSQCKTEPLMRDNIGRGGGYLSVYVNIEPVMRNLIQKFFLDCECCSEVRSERSDGLWGKQLLTFSVQTLRDNSLEKWTMFQGNLILPIHFNVLFEMHTCK